MRFGEKVKIRAMLKNDLEALHKIYIEPEILPIMSTRADISPAFLEAKLDTVFDKNDKKGEWLLLENEEGNIIGTITYENAHWGSEFQIVNFGISAAYRNKGYGTDTIKVLCKYLFEEKGPRRLHVSIREDFKAALRAFEKAGFVREGTRRQSAFSGGKALDEVYMSILFREYFGK